MIYKCSIFSNSKKDNTFGGYISFLFDFLVLETHSHNFSYITEIESCYNTLLGLRGPILSLRI